MNHYMSAARMRLYTTYYSHTCFTGVTTHHTASTSECYIEENLITVVLMEVQLTANLIIGCTYSASTLKCIYIPAICHLNLSIWVLCQCIRLL